jgi:hypothetical protein
MTVRLSIAQAICPADLGAVLVVEFAAQLCHTDASLPASVFKLPTCSPGKPIVVVRLAQGAKLLLMWAAAFL